MLKRTMTLIAGLVMTITLSAEEDSADFIRLVAALDEPEFYCFDLAGWGAKLQLDDPLQTHTCKNRNAADQMFRFADGQLRVSGHDRCVQVAGSSGITLTGSAVLARPCSDSPLQKLSLDEAGLVRIGDSDLCLGAGVDSAEASGPSHMWRTLSVMDCGADSDLVIWQVGL